MILRLSKEKGIINYDMFTKRNSFVENYLLTKINKLNTNEKIDIIIIWSRASTIIPIMIGHVIAIHNGKEHLPIYRCLSTPMIFFGQQPSTSNFRSSRLCDSLFVRMKYMKFDFSYLSYWFNQ